MMVDANVVIDVFESCIDCLTSLLSTTVGAWIGGCIVLMFIFTFIKKMQTI